MSHIRSVSFAFLMLFLGFASNFTCADDSHFKKVVTVVLENTSYSEALRQPFFKHLTEQGALLTQCFAETHPSQPNYIAMIAGDTLGVRRDGVVNLSETQVGDLLERGGRTWKAYAEDYPGNCFLGASRGLYARKHVPFLSFESVQKSPARCAQVVGLDQWGKDLASNQLPDYSLFIPNLSNDGHDTGAAHADRWLAATFGPVLANSELMRDLLVIVTFDEAELLGPNQIFTVLVGAGVKPGSRVDTHTNHYTLLRTIEDEFRLGTLGRGDATAAPLTGIWKSSTAIE